MPILDKENSVSKKRYLDFVSNYEDSSILQSLLWENIRKDVKYEAVYLEKNNEIIATMTLCIIYINEVKGNIMYSPKGPLCTLENIELVKMLIEEARPLIKKYKVFAFKFDSEIENNPKLIDLYKKEGFSISDKSQNKYNFKLNLRQKNELDLLRNFSDETRTSIKEAQRADVRTKHGNTYNELQAFYNLYKKMGRENKFIYREYEYFKMLLDTFKENIRIYIAVRDDKDIGAAICINFGRKVSLLYDATIEENKVYNPHYLMYNNILKWALESKCKICDLGGMYKTKENSEIFKIKKGFCLGDNFSKNIGEIDKIFNSFKYNRYIKNRR